MNRGHASLARWGMGCMEWQADWSVLDIGCGGGANLAQILKRCPAGKAYGIDLSQESVAFARRKNRRLLGTRCFVERGDVGKLPYGDGTFGAVTAFETVYFWDDLPEAFAEDEGIFGRTAGNAARSSRIRRYRRIPAEKGGVVHRSTQTGPKRPKRRKAMNAIKNITVGHTERLRKPVGFTMLANLVNIVPFCLSIEAVNVIFRACDGSGTPLDTARLWTIFGILAVYMAAMALAERAAYRANFRGAYEMSAEGRISLAEHLRKLSLGFLSRRDPGDLSSMLITDFTMAETGISHHLPQLMGAMVMPVLAFLTLLWIDWRMATAMFVALPLAIGILLASTRIQQKLSSHQIAAKIEAGNRLEEYLQGIRVMKAYNMVGGRFVRLREAFAQLRRACIRQEALLGPFVLLSITVVRAGLTLMVLCGTYLLLDGTLSLLMFVMFLIVGSRVFDPLTSALTNFAEFRYFSIAGGRILSLMEEPEMTGNRKAPENGDITLEGVSFAYHDKEVLHDVSLTLPQGSLTALVGPSGSGKSTLMKLCARFYDPQRGHVLFNGVRMDEIEPESLMRHISMVFQDVYLFQDTIRNNIRFGKADATDEQIVAAAKKACCHDFIMRLPKGYDTMVGEGGCTLSGGEKQRLSIARAILKDAQTILLDEATASLDPENEVEVQRAINTLIAGRTVIVIAHRLKTIRNADNIVVLDQGRIAEQGTHDQLVAHGGLYARLWAIQERTAGWSITS